MEERKNDLQDEGRLKKIMIVITFTRNNILRKQYLL